MGMDLYKYKVTSDTHSKTRFYFYSDKHLKKLSNFEIIKEEMFDFEQIVKYVENQFNISFSDLQLYDFSEDLDKQYIFVLKEDIQKQFLEYEDKFYDFRRKEDFDYKEYEQFLDKFEKIVSSLNEKEQKIYNDYGYVYIFDKEKLPKKNVYRILGYLSELSYIRKPFVDFEGKTTKKNKIISVGDFSGTLEEAKETFLQSIVHDDTGIAFFTKEHEVEDLFLARVPEYRREEIKKELFPLKKDEIIFLSW